jgi:endonuclease/exonuclease/phosphatase family metal-dependent hydrolase
MFRVMTYNVHRCVGVDGRLDVGRIAAVIAHCRPDVVALQELDVGRARTGGVDQAHAIAQRLGMDFHFHPAMHVEEERYGDAILTELPLKVMKADALPGSPTIRRLEPRGALWLRIEVDGRPVNVINTHFGLVPHEQRAQAAALCGSDWLGRPDCVDPVVLVGDFNATQRYSAYRMLAARLHDARAAAGGSRATPTFPSRFPVLPIDHVFVSSGVKVLDVSTPSGPLMRSASDHLPLLADLALR